MKLNKNLTILVAGMLAASVFAGCGQGGGSSSAGSSAAGSSDAAGGSSTSATESKTSGGEVEIEFLQQKREAVNTFDALIKKFEEANPGIKVKQNTVPDAGTVLMARASSGEMPDVLTHWPTDAAYVQFATEGHLRDLTDNPCMDNIIDSYKESVKIDGKLYTFPVSLNFMGVFYDVDKFSAAGYEIPKTWDEMIKIAEDIKSKGEVAFLFPDKDSWTISQCWDNISGKDRGSNAEIFAALNDGSATFQDDPIYVDSLTKMVALRDYSQGDTLSLGYDQAINDFATGTGYMFVQGIWALPSIESANPEKNVSMFPMPNAAGDMKQPLGVDVAICAGAHSEAKTEQVDKFLAFLTSTEAAQMYSDMDHSPSCIKGVNANIPKAKPILDLIDTAGVLDVAVPPPGFEETKRSKLQQVLIDKDVNAFLTTMTEDWKASAGA